MPIKEKKKKRIVIIPSRSKLITKIPTTIANTILLFLQGIDATFYLDIVRKFHKNIIPSSYTLTLNKHPSLCLRRIFTYTELTSLNLNFAGREILAIDHLTNLHLYMIIILRRK
jgi:hypothetical protein